MLLIIVGLQCIYVEKGKYSKFCDFKIEGSSFIVGDSLDANKLICFYTESCCPTCVFDVMKYSVSIKDCPGWRSFINCANTVL